MLCRNRHPEDVMLLCFSQGVLVSEDPGERPRDWGIYSRPSQKQHFTASYFLRQY